jgi:hypothetical protein
MLEEFERMHPFISRRGSDIHTITTYYTYESSEAPEGVFRVCLT